MPKKDKKKKNFMIKNQRKITQQSYMTQGLA